MQIQGTSQVHGAQAIAAPHNQQLTQPASQPSPVNTTDEVSFSAEAQLVAQASELPEIRENRVNELRDLIQSGQYETADRLEGAIDNLLDELV